MSEALFVVMLFLLGHGTNNQYSIYIVMWPVGACWCSLQLIVICSLVILRQRCFFSPYSAHIWHLNSSAVSSACSHFTADIWHLKMGHMHILKIVLKAYTVSSQLTVKLKDRQSERQLMMDFCFTKNCFAISGVYFPLQLHRLSHKPRFLCAYMSELSYIFPAPRGHHSEQWKGSSSTAQNTLLLIQSEDKNGKCCGNFIAWWLKWMK